MGERSIIAVVSELRKGGLTVEQQILIDELLMLCVRSEARAEAAVELAEMEIDRREEQRAAWREKKREYRMSLRHPETSQDKKEKSPTPPKEKNILIPPPSPVEDDGFPVWYEAYPKHEARRAAEKAYRHALKRGATPENLLEGAKRYRSECEGREKQFIALPATWLNADRWLDEPGKTVVSFVYPPKRSWAEIRAEREAKRGNETGG